jgi:hypothetical protein
MGAEQRLIAVQRTQVIAVGGVEKSGNGGATVLVQALLDSGPVQSGQAPVKNVLANLCVSRRTVGR